ncbi:MAG TPA: CHASE2 domain-containing protein, partial [Allosphingosinicella sp.]
MTLRRIQSGSFPLKALLTAFLIGLAAAFLHLGDPLENAMKLARIKLRDHPPSGQIVLVAIDDRSLAEFGAAPWSGTRIAELLDRVRAANPRAVHLDTALPGEGASSDAARLEASLAAFDAPVTLPARFSIDRLSERRAIVPPPRFARHAQLVNTNLYEEWDGRIWSHLYGAVVGERFLPSLATSLAGRDYQSSGHFPIDHALNARTIPVVSAGDLLGNRVRPSQLAGKSVVIARTDIGADHFVVPGTGLVPAIMFHILAAETLVEGTPINAGWFPPLVLAMALASIILISRRRSVAAGTIIFAAVAFLVGPLLLEFQHIHV